MTDRARRARRVDDAWSPGDTFAVALRVRETVFSRQWATYRGGGRFQFYWETYWSAVGGGPATATGAWLHLDAEGNPEKYEVFSDRSALRVAEFGPRGVEVELADGSAVALPMAEPVDFVFQHNAISQLAVILPLLAPRSGTLRSFSPDTLGVRPVELARLPQGGWRSPTLGADLAVDARGRLTRLRAGDADAEVGGCDTASFPGVDFEDLRRPRLPGYRSPAGVVAEDVAVPAEVRIGAALSRPAAGPASGLPALLFVQGSGRHDRHGMVPGLDTGIHDLVDALSARGWAALRYDARGAGTTPFGDLLELGFETVVDDARAALRVLLQRPEVDPGRYFLAGHSLGALAVLAIAADAPPGLRGAVLLAPPGRRIEAVLIDQAEREGRRLGFPDDVRAQRRAALRRQLRQVRADDRAREAARRGRGGGDSPGDRRPRVTGPLGPLLPGLVGVDPVSLLGAVTVPVLIVQGAKDIQVSLRKDSLRLLEAAATRSLDVELHVVAQADHLLRREPATSLPGRYFVERPISAEVVDTVAGWLSDHLPDRDAAHGEHQQ